MGGRGIQQVTATNRSFFRKKSTRATSDRVKNFVGFSMRRPEFTWISSCRHIPPTGNRTQKKSRFQYLARLYSIALSSVESPQKSQSIGDNKPPDC
jgi:hypothetical protein